MEKLKLGANAVEKVLAEGSLMSRDSYRRIKQMDRPSMERYLAEVYKSGFVDGMDAVQNVKKESNVEEVVIEWEEIEELLLGIKGIGPATIKAINEKMMEVY